MDIAKAIIAGIATIVSALLTLFLKEFFDRKKEPYKKIDEQLKDAVLGTWRGSFQQTLNGTSQVLSLELLLKVSSSGSISGKATYIHEGEKIIVNLKGGFYSHRFIKMEYENPNKAVLQFGSFVFKLSDDAKKLVGHFVGHGVQSGKVVGGSAELEKV